MDLTQDQNDDNKLEDYFFELLISKHATDKEITDLLNVVDESSLHLDYKILVKRVLFGQNNLFVENWGTLQDSLLEIAKSECLRTGDVDEHGVVMELLFKMIEYIFDIDDENMLGFIMSNKKEDVENRIVSLMKRVLDYFEIGLKKLLEETSALAEKIEDPEKVASEFLVIKKTLQGYPKEILTTQKDKIHEIKIQVDEIGANIKKRRR